MIIPLEGTAAGAIITTVRWLFQHGIRHRKGDTEGKIAAMFIEELPSVQVCFLEIKSGAKRGTEANCRLPS